MRNVIILGAGGAASAITFYIEEQNSRNEIEEKINILGYIGDKPDIDIADIDNLQTTQLTDSLTVGCENVHGCDNLGPQTDGRYVVWQAFKPVIGSEIWFFDTVTGQRNRISPLDGGNHFSPVIAEQEYTRQNHRGGVL